MFYFQRSVVNDDYILVFCIGTHMYFPGKDVSARRSGLSAQAFRMVTY